MLAGKGNMCAKDIRFFRYKPELIREKKSRFEYIPIIPFRKMYLVTCTEHRFICRMLSLTKAKIKYVRK